MEYLHIDLNNGSERRSRLLIEDFLSDQMRWSTSAPVTVRKRFGGVFLDKEGRLALRSPGGIFTFDFLGDELVLLETSRRFGPIGPVRNFGRVRANVGGRFRLSVATWSDGSRAFLDSRGMLHLKGDRSMPELSFALTNPLALAAWSSEGKVWGPKYLVGDAEQAPASYFAELLRKFVARLR